MKKIGNGAVRILYSVLFCLVSLGLTWVPSPQITTAQAASAFDSAWDALTNVEGLINALPDSAFRNRKNRDALLDKIDATFDQLETGAYTGYGNADVRSQAERCRGGAAQPDLLLHAEDEEELVGGLF